MSRESELAPGTQWVDVSPRDLQAFDTNVAHSARVHDWVARTTTPPIVPPVMQ
jgi:hypothetical protein